MSGRRNARAMSSIFGPARASSRDHAIWACSRSNCRQPSATARDPGNEKATSGVTPGPSAGVTVNVAVQPEGDSLKLAYTLTNTGSNTLDAVQLHTCVPTTDAPGFFPTLSAQNGATNCSELYQRLNLWSGGRPVAFSESLLAKSQVHLALMRKGAAPVRWSWWVNGPETFDLPLIALTSRDGSTRWRWRSSRPFGPRRMSGTTAPVFICFRGLGASSRAEARPCAADSMCSLAARTQSSQGSSVISRPRPPGKPSRPRPGSRRTAQQSGASICRQARVRSNVLPRAS